MGALDILLATLILGGAFWLLYRSLWKTRGHCQGCNGGTCSKK